MEKQALPPPSLVAVDVPISWRCNKHIFHLWHLSGVSFLASAKFPLAQGKREIPQKWEMLPTCRVTAKLANQHHTWGCWLCWLPTWGIRLGSVRSGIDVGSACDQKRSRLGATLSSERGYKLRVSLPLLRQPQDLTHGLWWSLNVFWTTPQCLKRMGLAPLKDVVDPGGGELECSSWREPLRVTG